MLPDKRGEDEGSLGEEIRKSDLKATDLPTFQRPAMSGGNPEMILPSVLPDRKQNMSFQTNNLHTKKDSKSSLMDITGMTRSRSIMANQMLSSLKN
jgi:hypothetical protein